MKYFKSSKGFTLIELLVVIAIISLLSSVILASLNSARTKTKDAAIKEEVSQMISLLALNNSDYGGYTELQPSSGWINQTYTCATIPFSGNYATQARAICTNIYNNASDFAAAGGAFRLWYGVTGSTVTQFSVMVALNDGKWYCAGSGGGKGEYAAYSGSPGCFDNP